ncbi:MAG: RNA-binding S4 domain-containing protein, partial [Bacillota bacterium]|nr:RNA-binding S4 domain-containing protein [Bacillota bacterium]
MKEILINNEFIKLDQFLKFVGIASTGGHAKYLILNNFIEINEYSVNERGKKLRNGDIVRIHIEDENIYK